MLPFENAVSVQFHNGFSVDVEGKIGLPLNFCGILGHNTYTQQQQHAHNVIRVESHKTLSGRNLLANIPHVFFL